MFPPFDQDEAFSLCQRVARLLDEGALLIEKRGSYPTSRADTGVMLGSLIAYDKITGESHALYTVSGVTRRIAGVVAGAEYVESVVPLQLIETALAANDRLIHDLTRTIASMPQGDERVALKKKRTSLCDASIAKVFSLYHFACATGQVVSLDAICAKKHTLPPAGTGECATVKLLHHAFSHHLVPKSLCEVFYSKGRGTSLEMCPPCDTRCAFVLDEMLRLRIVFRDEQLIVVEKPSGLLSVPGRGDDKRDCVASRVRTLYPECIAQPAVHRLDMETSGLMVLSFTKEAHLNLSRQFAEGRVVKRYEALLDGNLLKTKREREGQLELYFRLDVDNRPHQVWDAVYGKKAITRWKVVRVERYISPSGKVRHVTRCEFVPLTGRTHQIRLACASEHGLSCPIVGDTLYGSCQKSQRLMLHATHLSFCHPTTGALLTFTSPCPF